MLSTMRSLLKDESGATAIEYALLVAGVGVTLIAAFSGVTDSIKSVLTSVKSTLTTAAGG
ncbi:Flp family type IVb pilin [Azospirillum sp. sgz301742]